MKRLIFVLAIATTACAAPFDPKDVAPDPAILVHLDFDALRTSLFAKDVLSSTNVQQKLADWDAALDFDFRTQLHGLTIYTTQSHPADGVLIVYADFDPNHLIKLAQDPKFSLNLDSADIDSDGLIRLVSAPKIKPDTKGSHVIYSWLDLKARKKDPAHARVYGAMWGNRVVFGRNEDHLVDALNVIASKAPSFSGKPGLPKFAPGETAILQGAVFKFESNSEEPEAAIFRMSKAVRIKLSETASNLTASLQFEAPNSTAATQLSQVVQGLIALAKLQTSDAGKLEFINAIALQQDGSMVNLAVSLPSSDVAAHTEVTGASHTDK